MRKAATILCGVVLLALLYILALGPLLALFTAVGLDTAYLNWPYWPVIWASRQDDSLLDGYLWL